jgi:hypothetical protein
VQRLGLGVNSIDGFAIAYWHHQVGCPGKDDLTGGTIDCHIRGGQTERIRQRSHILESPIESRRFLLHHNIGRTPGGLQNSYREHAITNFLVKQRPAARQI